MPFVLAKGTQLMCQLVTGAINYYTSEIIFICLTFIDVRIQWVVCEVRDAPRGTWSIAVGSSLALVAYETSQVLLPGSQVFFLGISRFHPTYRLTYQNKWINLDGPLNPNKKNQIKSLLKQVLSELEFYGDKFWKIGRNNFSDQFKIIIRYSCNTFC